MPLQANGENLQSSERRSEILCDVLDFLNQLLDFFWLQFVLVFSPFFDLKIVLIDCECCPWPMPPRYSFVRGKLNENRKHPAEDNFGNIC